MLSDRFYLLCWRVLGSSGRFSIVWDRGADPCLPEDILPWRGKDKRQERNENKIQKDKMWQMMEVVKQWRRERLGESWARGSARPFIILDFSLLLLMYNSPSFVRTSCCQSERPEEISGCSVVYHYVARRTAVVMMHPTSERQVTDWSAELKQEDRVSADEKWIDTMLYFRFNRLTQM